MGSESRVPGKRVPASFLKIRRWFFWRRPPQKNFCSSFRWFLLLKNLPKLKWNLWNWNCSGSFPFLYTWAMLQSFPIKQGNNTTPDHDFVRMNPHAISVGGVQETKMNTEEYWWQALNEIPNKIPKYNLGKKILANSSLWKSLFWIDRLSGFQGFPSRAPPNQAWNCSWKRLTAAPGKRPSNTTIMINVEPQVTIITSWWFQPVSKILVKLDHFPK